MKLNLDYTDKTILAISDMHIPYHHPDALDFLAALKSLYKPDLVVNLGDCLDFHGISFHDSDPELASAGDELVEAVMHIEELEKLFPDMFIVGSNHGDLPLRKFMANGIPSKFIKSYNDIYEVGDGWKFVTDLTIVSKRKVPDIYICHSIRKNALQVAQQRGQRFMCGHFHENFSVNYAGNPNSLLWAVMAGCLIDKASLAFKYNKLNLNRPILGTAVIERGIPTIIPMILDKKVRWIQEIV